ncbi:MAG: glycosyltransferase family 9 protein [Nitrospinota bacterium]
MKKILILNLSRLGDHLQTSPLIAGLKLKEPDCRITLLGNVKFIGMCEHLPYIDSLKVFDIQQFERKKGDDPISYLDVYRYLDRLIEELRVEKFDMLINLTHSRVSGLMGQALGIKEALGTYSTSDGYKVINNPWLIYFNSFIEFRHYNSLNLVDIYQLGGGVKPSTEGLLINDVEGTRAASPILDELGIAEGENVIGIAAGASMVERRWPPKKFAEAADIISEKRGAKVLIFGGPTEFELGRELASHMKRPAINLAGRTSLAELIGLVKRCSMLLTNDTGTMHVAAAVGTPVVALFFVHAYGAETGPYGEGHIVIEPEIDCFPCAHKTTCPHHACFDRVSPLDVSEAAEYLPSTECGNGFYAPNDSFPTTRVYRTCFDDLGLFDLKPLKKMPMREADIFSRIYRYMFLKASYGEIDPACWSGCLKDNFIQWDKEQRDAWVKKKAALFEGLAATAEQALKLIEKMGGDYKKGDIEAVKRSAPEIVRFDRKITNPAFVHEELMPIASLFNRGKGNITDMAFEIMLVKTRLLYASVRDSALSVRRMLEQWGTTKTGGRRNRIFADCNNERV